MWQPQHATPAMRTWGAGQAIQTIPGAPPSEEIGSPCTQLGLRVALSGLRPPARDARKCPGDLAGSSDSAGAARPAGVSPRGGALFADVGQQGHEAGPLDGPGQRVLADGRATALAAADDAAMPIDELAEQLDVLVIDPHGTRALSFYEQGVAFLAAAAAAGSSFRHNAKTV